MQIDISKLKPDELNAYAAIVSDVRLWAEAFLVNPDDETPFKLNYVQKKILAPGKLKKVIRVHRRGGKSYCLAILALWYALTHQSAQVLIICPDMGKVQNIMRSIDEFLRVSEFISGEVRASTKMPAIREFKNGSMIKGFTLGSNSKTQGKGVRGNTADLVIIDEAAFLNDDDWPAIEPIIQGDATRPEVITYISSTPTADRNRYWELCTQANYDAVYDRIHVPVTENPDYSEERVSQIKSEVNSFTYQQEWCHLPSTLVTLADGTTKEFKDLRVGDKLLYLDEWLSECSCSVIDFRSSGNKPLVELVDDCGNILTTSSGHKLKIYGNKVSVDETTEMVYHPTLDYNMSKEAMLARLVAYNTGDGTLTSRISKSSYTKKDGSISIYENKNNIRYQAAYYSSSEEDIQLLCRDLRLSGIQENARRGIKKGNAIVKDSLTIQIGTGAYKLLELGCPVGSKVRQAFRVPDWIMSGTSTVKSEYLAALFGAEGTISAEKLGKVKRHKAITLSMHKKPGIDGSPYFNDLVTLLQELGISSSFRVYKHGENSFTPGNIVYSLDIKSGVANNYRFLTRIGFRYCIEKQIKAYLWKSYYEAYMYAAKVRNSPQPTRNFPYFRDWVGSRWNGCNLKLKVVERRELPPQEVFNITVDSPDHSYLLANGLDNFNCASFPDIGEGVYKRSYIDRAQRDYTYYDPKDLKSIPYPAVRTIGVDWDKFNGTGPNIYVLELDKANNRVFGCYHEEIDPGEYCLTMAVNRIIELNTIFNPQHIFVDRGYGECVAPNTRVTTARGLIPIIDVLIGDRVLTVEGTFDRVLDKVIKTEPKDTYKVYVSNFSSVDVSSTHPFYTIDATGQTSWKNVTELKVGDLVATPRDTELSIDSLEVRTDLHIFLPIRKIEYIGKVSGLVDICVEGGHSFVGNGVVLHNTQIETLHLHGKWHPETGLASKVRGVSFSESIEVLDPITKEHIKKRIKPVMVNITVKWMEDGKFVYPRSHEKFTTQLQDFKVISITDSSIKYSSENEHIIDAFMLAAFALYENYEDPFGIAPAITSYLLPTPEYVEDDSVTKKQAFGYVSQVGIMSDFKRRNVPALTYNKMDNAGGLDLRRMF